MNVNFFCVTIYKYTHTVISPQQHEDITMYKFSSIDRFRTALKGVHRYCHDRGQSIPIMDYIGTVKLHGTNAGVRRTASGKIVPQSRNRILDVTCDNYGFAAFVEERKEAFEKLFDFFNMPDTDITLFGEFCGKGIQGNVAIGQLDPHFVLFNVKFDGEYNELWYPFPVELQANDVDIYNIFQIPHYEISVDFSAPDAAIHEINELTDAVEEQCPWGKFMGVDGIGEGIVWVPRNHPSISDLWFKTKGGKHSGKPKVKGIRAKVDVETANSIAECMKLVLPEWRLQQGIEYLKENYYDMDHSSIGPYLKWISQDILKEEIDTITENGLEWKDMHRPINKRARNYILDVIENDFSV